MTGWGKRARRWLRRVLAGVKFTRSVERFDCAAQELDKAVREVLTR